MEDRKAAVFQGVGRRGNAAHNLEIIARVSVAARGKGASLLVFPELFLVSKLLAFQFLQIFRV